MTDDVDLLYQGSAFGLAFLTGHVVPLQRKHLLAQAHRKLARALPCAVAPDARPPSSSTPSNLQANVSPGLSKDVSVAPQSTRSKLVLTRRVFSWTLRRRLAKAARFQPPLETTENVQSSVMPPPLQTLLGQQIPADILPIEAMLSPTEPVATFVLQRGHTPFSTRRRSGDPPSRFLRLSYALVEPFSQGALNCSNPRATGSLKGWYQVASRWNVLNADFRPPLILSSAQRVYADDAKLRRHSSETDLTMKTSSPSAPSSSIEGGTQIPISPLLRRNHWERALGRSPRVIAIGDVHGCIDELQQLLRLADFQPGDQVVLLGDLVAKGPDSVGVVQLAREIGARSVRGNHDFEVVRWWEAHRRGNDDALVSMEHARIARALGEAEHTWLLECPWFIECAEMSHLFVHAGFIPGVKLTQQNPRLMMNMRSVLQDGTVTAKNVERCEWAKLWQGPQTVVFGHDAVRGLQKHEFAKGIDTGCVYGGRLTALLLPENRLISVSAKRAYIAPKRYRIA